MSPVRTRSVHQLHVELSGLTLPELVDVVAEQALLPLPEPERRRYMAQVRANVERVLRKHIVALDMCGLADVCQSSQPYDPWEGAPQG
ncbi:MAG TPA: hypothetical protein VIK73_03050 [Limnochordales bacterium]